MDKNTLAFRIIKSVWVIASLIVFSLSAHAVSPVVWETRSRAELLRGEARGVSVTDTGALMLAPGFTQLFDTAQAYVWSSASDSMGNVYLGTGHDGRVFRVGPDGRGTLLYDAPELDVSALTVDSGDTLYAGTSPDGKVYRINRDGRADVYFDPPDKYIWSLAVMSDGALAIGTGDSGRLYRVRAAGAQPEASVLIDTNETHVISLAVSAEGNLFAGTDPGGLVLRVSPNSKAFALFDAPLREIHALAVAPDNSIYALALSDAATAARAPTAAPVSTQPASGGAGVSGSVSMTITSVDDAGGGQPPAAPPPRSRSDLANARSAVFRIQPDGEADVVWSSPTITAFAVAVAPQGSSVLIGTSDRGRIYSVTRDGRDKLLLQSTEGQISSFTVRGSDVFTASSNGGKLFRFAGETVSEGTYESPVRDAKFVASWGRIQWRAQGDVQLQTRTGNTERPDMTWSEWSASYRDSSSAAVVSPRARFIQWRAVLRRTAAKESNVVARAEDVSITYLPRNVAPEVLAITKPPVGVGFQQTMQPQVDPNIESSGLDATLFGPSIQTPPRRIFQRGAVSLQWQAEDRNGDEMEYTVYYRGVNEEAFRLLKDRLRENYYTVDGAALADGRYVFKIVASDAPDNPVEQALTGERISEPIEIDNMPPMVRSTNNNGGGDQGQTDRTRQQLRFTVEDASGTVRRADISVDGAAWRMIFPEDGIADGPRETYRLDLPVTTKGEHTISLRAFDASGNIGSARIVVRR